MSLQNNMNMIQYPLLYRVTTLHSGLASWENERQGSQTTVQTEFMYNVSVHYMNKLLLLPTTTSTYFSMADVLVDLKASFAKPSLNQLEFVAAFWGFCGHVTQKAKCH